MRYKACWIMIFVIPGNPQTQQTLAIANLRRDLVQEIYSIVFYKKCKPFLSVNKTSLEDILVGIKVCQLNALLPPGGK